LVDVDDVRAVADREIDGLGGDGRQVLQLRTRLADDRRRSTAAAASPTIRAPS
jgi:hypothetical protein